MAAIPDVCRRDDGKRVDECPQTCAAACESSSFNRGPVIAAACDRLMARKGQQDAPACREAAAQSTLDVCLKKAAARPGLLDKLNQQVTSVALRDSLNKLLATPAPPTGCAPAPAALRLMYDCIGDEANQIQNGYRSLQDRLGGTKAQNRCDRPISEYDQAYQILDGLKQRADNINLYSEKTLLPCSTEWQDWMDAKSKATDQTGNSPFLLATLNEIISGLSEDLRRVADTKSKAEDTIKEIKASLDRVQASVISALLLCDR